MEKIINNPLFTKILLGLTLVLSSIALVVSLTNGSSSLENEIKEPEFRVADGELEYRLGDGDWEEIFNLSTLIEDFSDGTSVESATINASGELILTLSDGTTINAGNALGEAGVSISNAEINALGELIITLSNDSTPLNLGVVSGPTGIQGVGVSSAAVNASGELVITLTDGSNPVNLGVIQGDDGKSGDSGVSVSNAALNASNELVLTYSDGTSQNLGVIQGLSAYDLYVQMYPGYTKDEREWLKDFIFGELAITVHFQYETSEGNFAYTVETFQGVYRDEILEDLLIEDSNDFLPTYFTQSGLYQVEVSSPISAVQFYSEEDYDFERVRVADQDYILLLEDSENEYFEKAVLKPTATTEGAIFFAYGIKTPAELQYLSLHLTSSALLLNDIILPEAVTASGSNFDTLDADLRTAIIEAATATGYPMASGGIDNFNRLNFLPIGNANEDHVFKGNLYGNLKSVENFSLDFNNISSDSGFGLFSVVEDVLIENITLKNAEVISDNSSNFEYDVSLLIGILKGDSQLNHISVSGILSSNSNYGSGLLAGLVSGSSLSLDGIHLDGQIDADEYIGGAFGYMVNTTLSALDVVVLVALNGNSDIGGFAGFVDDSNLDFESMTFSSSITAQNDSTGGVFGYIFDSNVTVKEMTLTTEIESTGGYLGGFIGDSENSNLEFDSVTISSIIHASGTDSGGVFGLLENSNVTVTSMVLTSDIQSTNDNAGGFIGAVDTNSNVIVNSSTFNVEVSGKESVGGLIGYADDSNFESHNLNISSHAIASHTTSNVGGLIGRVRNMVITLSALHLESTVDASGSNAGGLFGVVEGTSTAPSNILIETSLLVGTVNSNGNSVGLIGQSKDTIISISSTSILAMVRADADDVGGLIGYVNRTEMNLINIDFAADVTAKDDVGGLIGRSEAGENSTLTAIGSEFTVTVIGKTNFDLLIGSGTVDGLDNSLIEAFTSFTLIQAFSGSETPADIITALNNASYSGITLFDDVTFTGGLDIPNGGTIDLNELKLTGDTILITGSGQTIIENGALTITTGQTVGTSTAGILVESNVTTPGSLTLKDVVLTFEEANSIGVYVSSGAIDLENVTLSGVGTGILISGSGVYETLTDIHFDVTGTAIVINANVSRSVIDALILDNTFGEDVSAKVIAGGVVYNQTLTQEITENILLGNVTDSALFLDAGFTGVNEANASIIASLVTPSSVTEGSIQTLINVLNRLNNGSATINDFNSFNFNDFGLKNTGIQGLLNAYNTASNENTSYLDLEGIRSLLISVDSVLPIEPDINAELIVEDGNAVSVTWDASSDNLTPDNQLIYSLYAVSQATPSGTFVTSGTSITSFTVLDLALETTFTFKLIITDLSGNERIVTTGPLTTGNEETTLIFGGGNGTIEKPYQISTWEHLDNIRLHMDAHYILTQTLDNNSPDYLDYNSTSAGLKGWVPIGQISPSAVEYFTGTFDGSGNEINDLVIHATENYSGLFSSISGAAIKDFSLSGTVGPTINLNNVGVLAGSIHHSVITNIHLSGILDKSIVTTNIFGFNQVAIMAGSSSHSIISGSSVSGNVNVGSNGAGFFAEANNTEIINSSAEVNIIVANNVAGGMIGLGQNITLSGVYAIVDLSAFTQVGGLIGAMNSFTSTITNEFVSIIDAYVIGDLNHFRTSSSGGDPQIGAGGLIGVTRSVTNQISNAYSIVNITRGSSDRDTFGLIIGNLDATVDGRDSSTRIKAINLFENIYYNNDESNIVGVNPYKAIGDIISGADDIDDLQASLTDTEFSSHSTNSFIGFSTDIWTFEEGFYPYLQLQGSASDFNNPTNINDYVTP